MHLNPQPLRTGRFIACLVLMCGIFFSSCKKNDSNSGGTQPPQNNGGPIELSGSIIGKDGLPLAGAIVKADGQQVTTNDKGTFVLQNVKTATGNVVVVNCSKAGFRTQVRRLVTAGGNNATVQMMLLPSTTTHTINATAGGTATLTGGATVTIPPDAVVKSDGSAYTGAVNFAIAHLDPAAPDFSLQIPGGDLSAIRTDNSNVVLYSYGMLQVEMESTAGEKLQLKTGKSSTIKFPISQFQQTAAPNTIPLWHFDEVSGIWKEEGSATRQGNLYVGTVGHFSSWNVDAPSPIVTVMGCLTDPCRGDLKMRGVNVTIGQVTVQTDKDGNYKALIPSDMPATLHVQPRLNGGRGTKKELPAYPPGGSTTQNVSLPCGPELSGRITACDGTPYAGMVSMYLDGENIGNAYTDETSTFKLFPPKGKTITLKVFDLLGNLTAKDITMPNGDNGKDIGDVKVCPGTELPPTLFIINGSGFNNQPVQIGGGTSGQPFVTIGIYDDRNKETLLTATQGKTQLTLQFAGGATGNFNDVVMILDLNGKRFVSEEMHVSVSRYGQVGQLIEGTFSGEGTIQGGTGKVQITAGKFTIFRIQG